MFTCFTHHPTGADPICSVTYPAAVDLVQLLKDGVEVFGLFIKAALKALQLVQIFPEGAGGLE